MPAASPEQQRIMGLALSYKRGKAKKKPSKKVKKILHSMSLGELEKMARKPKKGYAT